MKKNITLVVMAAGMGSRFGGLKQIERIGKNGEVLLDYSVHDALEAGFNKIVFVIKKEIEADFKAVVGDRIAKIADVHYAYQEVNNLPDGFECPQGRTKPWGTAQAILCCKDIVNESFAVVNADDFYGKSAFKKMYDQLSANEDNYCMVGYRLINTLTENGYVSRGVCETQDGMLSKITERTKILDCKYTEDEKNWISLAPDTIVSMNLWGFHDDIFAHLEKMFIDFLETRINEEKSECYLPSVVAGLIETGEKKVDVLIAEDKWYGVTYSEDKAVVVAAIAKMTAEGLY
ncbi:MAG: sugar phosphate nucleotidyltransferase [Clostridia bacterium]